MKIIIYLYLLLFFTSSTYSQENHIFEDFEQYKVGSFPSDNWKDIREISIPATVPDPSSKIILTKGPDGKETNAIQYADKVSTSGGIFREVGKSDYYKFSADIRIDRWSNSSKAFFTDWAWAMGVLSLPDKIDFNGGAQITFVAQPVAENWVLYALRSDVKSYNDFFNIEFPGKVKLGTWYHIEFSLDNKTGLVFTKVTDLSTGNVDLEEHTQIPNWNAEKSGNYTHFGTWDGEYRTDATIGNLTTIDNIKYEGK